MEAKDIWELSLATATTLFAAGAAWMAFAEFRRSRIHREEDLRWKQAEAAKAIIDEWLDDKKAYDFCRMIEYENRNFKNEEGKDFLSKRSLIEEALTDEDETTMSKKEVNKRYIRDCCDSFLYYTEMMNQGREGHLYLLENLLFPLTYYLRRMQEKGIYETVTKYARKYSYHGAGRLFDEIMK